MRTIVIRENTELPVDDELASAINKMLAEDSTLPIKIKDHTVSFADYTVGSLQVGEVNIEIKPRNPVFTLETLFEMLLFESLNNFELLCIHYVCRLGKGILFYYFCRSF